MCAKIYSAYLGYFESGKKQQHDSDEEKEDAKETTFENNNADAIPEGVSKLNKIISYDGTDSDS